MILDRRQVELVRQLMAETHWGDGRGEAVRLYRDVSAAAERLTGDGPEAMRAQLLEAAVDLETAFERLRAALEALTPEAVLDHAVDTG